MNINKHHNGLKVKCVKMPNASYTKRHKQGEESVLYLCKVLLMNMRLQFVTSISFDNERINY